MKWTVEELQRHDGETLSFDEYVRVDDLMEREPQIRDLSEVRVEGDVYLSTSLVSFHLKISGTMVLPCSLTLEDVRYPFALETIESFQLDATLDVSEGENEMIHQLEGNTIDLMPIIKDIVLLEIPMKVIHPEAKVEQSGDGWGIITEETKKDEIDPRLAKLAEFFKDNKNEED